jgi:hypothetical protein
LVRREPPAPVPPAAAVAASPDEALPAWASLAGVALAGVALADDVLADDVLADDALAPVSLAWAAALSLAVSGAGPSSAAPSEAAPPAGVCKFRSLVTYARQRPAGRLLTHRPARCNGFPTYPVPACWRVPSLHLSYATQHAPEPSPAGDIRTANMPL